MEELINTVKEMSRQLGRSEDYVTDMKRAGFRFPATLNEAIQFIRKTGAPGRFRTKKIVASVNLR